MSRQDRKERQVRRGFKSKVIRTVGKIPFSEEAVGAYCCATDSDTPAHVKAAIFAALAYFIAPVDAIPDFLLALGYTDDAAVFWAMWRTISGHVTEAHRETARRFFDKPEE